MPKIMTTKELAEYLRLHQIAICKFAAEGQIPAVRVGKVWRFDKEAIINRSVKVRAKACLRGKRSKPYN